MHSCIKRLLNNRDGESLGCLFKLVRIIDKELEMVTAKWVVDVYSERLDSIGKEGDSSARFSFILREAVDLRQGN